MNTQTYIVNSPVKLSDHFDIPVDNSLCKNWTSFNHKNKGIKHNYFFIFKRI